MGIEIESAAGRWVRPAVLAPGLAAAEDWTAAQVQSLGYASGQATLERSSDTRLWVAHRDGSLLLKIEMAWAGPGTPQAKATTRDGEIWRDDSVEIFLAAAEGLERPVQLVFNWAGVQGDSAFVYDTQYERVVKADADWNPDWSVAITPGANRYTALVRIPLQTTVGLAGQRGEVLRLNVVRNRVGVQPESLFWSPVEGAANLRPDYFGFVVLADAQAAAVALAELRLKSLNAVVIPERRRVLPVLVGQTARWRLLDPLHTIVRPSPGAKLDLELQAAEGAVVDRQPVKAVDGVLNAAVTVREEGGEFRLRCSSSGAGPVAGALREATLLFQPWRFVGGDDPDAFEITGKSTVRNFPRTIERKIRTLSRGSQLQFHFQARSVALCLPVALPLPGPQVGSPLLQQWRWKLDGGEWQYLTVAGSTQATILSNDLPAGTHTVTLEPFKAEGWLSGFVIGAAPLTRVHGVIHAEDFDELLTDVRADLLQDGRVVRSETVRTPHNGSFALLGLAPGRYTLRLSALGWMATEQVVNVPETSGADVDTGLWVLGRDGRFPAWRGETRPRFGQSICVAPGGSFSAVIQAYDSGPQKVQLVSAYRTVTLKVTGQEPLPFGVHTQLVRVTCEVPPDLPHDMYTLRVTYVSRGKPWDDECAQAVCVRPTLPEAFFVAGCGHTNTWGQETAEYLERVGRIAELAGAREFLVANEVNPAYVCGALAGLRIPYMTCGGNHTVGRWEEFYGLQPAATVDGGFRLVSFGQFPNESWGEAERLLTTSALTPPATVRAVLCFEGYAPIDLIRKAPVNLLFDGHSDEAHPQAAAFPAGTIHLRAPGQDTLRLVPMTATGTAVNREEECPVLKIARNEPDPLRVAFSAANDGTQTGLTATVVNASEIAFEGCRVRLVLAAGTYGVEGAKMVQQFTADDGKVTVVDLAVAVGAKRQAAVTVSLVR